MHPSDSSVQQMAEPLVLECLNNKENIQLVSRHLSLLDNVKLQLDGIDENKPTVCEIYAHIGACKGAQPNKIASDLLKMVLVERVKGGKWRKIFCFVDEEAAKVLTGKSWRAVAAKELEIEVRVCKIPPGVRSGIQLAQRDQIMVNIRPK